MSIAPAGNCSLRATFDISNPGNGDCRAQAGSLRALCRPRGLHAPVCTLLALYPATPNQKPPRHVGSRRVHDSPAQYNDPKSSPLPPSLFPCRRWAASHRSVPASRTVAIYAARRCGILKSGRDKAEIEFATSSHSVTQFPLFSTREQDRLANSPFALAGGNPGVAIVRRSFLSGMAAHRIFHVTFYKCGSQWVRDLLSDPAIVAHTRCPLVANGVDIPSQPWPIWLGPGLASPLYSASYVDWLERPNPDPEDRCFVVTRDPRDLVVSLVISLRQSHTPNQETALLRTPFRNASRDDQIRLGCHVFRFWALPL